jgi:glycyl-tRNA synthetase beta chain
MAERGAATTRRGDSLLMEIGTEELPPKALAGLGRAFAEGCLQNLRQAQLVESQTAYRWFATPRRIAVWVAAVQRRQPDQQVERRGPSIKAAFDSTGRPTKAALGFAGSCGVEVAALGRVKTDKGEWLVYREGKKGVPASALIPDCVAEAVRRLPIPKRMRWGDLDAEFVRPVHWVVLLHGKTPVRTELLSVPSKRRTHGHRFHAPGPLSLTHADDYERLLREQGMVVADFSDRRQRIVDQVERLAESVSGQAQIDEALLDEVTGLVEWPQALLGEFDASFLTVPPEVLVSSMRDHQKYFHVTNGRGRLLPFFITVSNIKSKSPKRVRAGNERVLRARLSDARFFWETDRKQRLCDRRAALAEVMFHNKLGSVADKVARLRRLAAVIAAGAGADAALSDRAATLCKADLVTEMVGEFPELQGIMGRYYAQHDGEDQRVADAIAEHYHPRFAGDTLPGSELGRVVALADRLDTLVGIFLAGEEPSGDKDPFGLRRAALGTLRIMIDGGTDLDLEALLVETLRVYGESGAAEPVGDGIAGRVFDFILERLNAHYAAQGFRQDEIAAVASRRPARPADFDRRLRAVAGFRALDEAANLAAANKRIRNILRKSTAPIPDRVNRKLLREPAERALADALSRLESEAVSAFDSGQYKQGLAALAALREPVDTFFDEVMVMTEDAATRDNRLAMLKRLHDLFLRVADISLLQIESAADA